MTSAISAGSVARSSSVVEQRGGAELRDSVAGCAARAPSVDAPATLVECL
jgi:hypothetical protein